MLLDVRRGILTGLGSRTLFGHRDATGLPVLYSAPAIRNVADDVWNATTGERIGGPADIIEDITPIDPVDDSKFKEIGFGR